MFKFPRLSQLCRLYSFFLILDPANDHTLHVVVLSLYSLLIQNSSPNLSWPFLTLTLLKNPGLLFCKKSLNLDLDSSWLDSVKHLWQWLSQVMLCPSSEDLWYQLVPSLVIKFDHLVKVASTRFLCCNDPFSPL